MPLRRRFGSIRRSQLHLDPASTAVANETVQATQFYTAEDNGLSRHWHSKVFLNPPYNGDAAQWSRRLVGQYEAGNVTEAILLVFSKLGYLWFRELFATYPVAFVRERIRFVNPETGVGAQAKHASCFVYFGPHRERFREVFRGVGRVFYPEEERCDGVAEPTPARDRFTHSPEGVNGHGRRIIKARGVAPMIW
jgi:hypothetical protein